VRLYYVQSQVSEENMMSRQAPQVPETEEKKDVRLRGSMGRTMTSSGVATAWRMRRETASKPVAIRITFYDSDSVCRREGYDKPQQGDNREKSEDEVLHCWGWTFALLRNQVAVASG
jgi:hypothetical protein